MKITWTEPALLDRAAIYDHVEADNPSAAAALDKTFLRAAERLSAFPEIGRIGRIAGTRELVAHPHYILVYDIAFDTVTIVALVHTSRQWPPIS